MFCPCCWPEEFFRLAQSQATLGTYKISCIHSGFIGCGTAYSATSRSPWDRGGCHYSFFAFTVTVLFIFIFIPSTFSFSDMPRQLSLGRLVPTRKSTLEPAGKAEIYNYDGSVPLVNHPRSIQTLPIPDEYMEVYLKDSPQRANRDNSREVPEEAICTYYCRHVPCQTVRL